MVRYVVGAQNDFKSVEGEIPYSDVSAQSKDTKDY